MSRRHVSGTLAAALLCAAIVHCRAPRASAEGAAGQAPGDPLSPVGTWKTIDDKTNEPKSLLKIWEKDGVLYGQIVKLFDPSEENPKCDKCDGALRDQPVIGMTIMRGLRRDGDEWNGGTIIDPESGNTYRCLVQVLDGGGRLKVRGYVGFSLLGRTQYWYRVK